MAFHFKTSDGIVHAETKHPSASHDETVCGMFLVTNPRHRTSDVVDVYGAHRAGEKPNGRPDGLAVVTPERVTCVVCLAGE